MHSIDGIKTEKLYNMIVSIDFHRIHAHTLLLSRSRTHKHIVPSIYPSALSHRFLIWFNFIYQAFVRNTELQFRIWNKEVMSLIRV